MSVNKYELASSQRRFLLRISEYLILISLNIVIMYLYTFKIVDFSNYDANYNHNLFSLAFTCAFITDFLFWSIYFIIIPYFYKGYTLLAKLFKLKLYCAQSEWKLLNFFKREILLWVPINILFIIIGLISFVFNDPINFLVSIVLINKQSNNVWQTIIATFLLFLNIILFLPIILAIINLFLNSKKSTFIDRFSHLKLLYMKPIMSIEDVKNNKESKTYDLPLLIDPGELEKL